MAQRYLQHIAGTLDASGNAQGQNAIASERMANWTEIAIAATLPATSASAQWTIYIGVGVTNLVHNIGTGLGTFIRTGPFILAPGETLIVVITGGNPGDSLIGTLFGVQGLDPTQLYASTPTGTQVSIAGGTVTATITQPLGVGITGANSVNIQSQSATLNVAFPSPQQVTINSGTVNATITGTPNINIQSQSVNLNTQQPQQSLGNFTVPGPNGNNNSGNISVPTGTHAIGLTVDANALSSLSVQGVTSGINYISLIGSQGFPLTGYFISPVLSVLDTQVKVTGTTNATWAPGPTVVRMVAILDAEGVFIFDNVTEPAAVKLISVGGNPYATAGAIGQQDVLAVGIPLEKNSGVGQQGTWSSSQITIPAGNGVTTTLIAANTARRGLIVFCAASTGIVNIQRHTGAANIISMPVQSYWEMPSPITTEQLDFFTNQANTGGVMIVTELT